MPECLDRDPHRDHAASWQLAVAAAVRAGIAVRWLEYPIWLWRSVRPADRPRPDETVACRLDIAAVRPQKRYAMQAYRSQVIDLVDDDPNGFRLSPHMLAYFGGAWEFFFAELPAEKNVHNTG